MSNNEEERGTLILPSSAVLPVRRALVDAINKERSATLDLAARIHAHLKSDAGKPDRLALSKIVKAKASYCGVEDDFFAKLIQRFTPSRSLGDDYDTRWDVQKLLLPRAQPVKPGETPVPRKLQSPKKKDYPLLPAQTWEFDGPECGVRIDPEKRTISWRVQNNNRSVERAWESPLGRALNAALAKVKWTRGTGGGFKYKNEYSEDAAMDHGGNAVSLSRTFGPLGEKEREYQYGMPLRRSPKRK